MGSHAESKGWIGEREEETELVYLNARFYDPEIGRFTAPDPVLRLGQGLNRYSYSWNNPINISDPSGPDPPGDPCAGMSYQQCFDFLNDNVQSTFEGNCETNPFCDPNGSALDIEGEQINFDRLARLEACMTYGDCENIPGYDSNATSSTTSQTASTETEEPTETGNGTGTGTGTGNGTGGGTTPTPIPDGNPDDSEGDKGLGVVFLASGTFGAYGGAGLPLQTD